jgi:hypothetical protein
MKWFDVAIMAWPSAGVEEVSLEVVEEVSLEVLQFSASHSCGFLQRELGGGGGHNSRFGSYPFLRRFLSRLCT